MKERIKQLVLSNPAARFVYSRAHEANFERSYRRRRERYQALVGNDPEAHSPEAALRRARQAIAARGYQPRPRQAGEVHTFAFLPSHWWHQNQIAAALAKLGPLSRFDYLAHGFQLETLRTRIPGARQNRERMLDLMLQTLRQCHRERPVDWFFAYALGWDMTAEVLERIKEELGIPTVNISLDDKNWWDEIERGDPTGGLKHVVPRFDLGWTSARAVLSWYTAEGGQGVFLPEGVNTDWFRPLEEVPQDVEVGFVGSNFGYRSELVEQLRRAGVRLVVHGPRWPEGTLTDEEMLRFFNRSRINLGLGDMHYSRILTNLKGRDFEVPATGRGVYLTAFNSDLAECFGVGRELLCYRGFDEMLELIRYYLRRPEECAEIARRARERCVREHQWRHRIETLLGWLGILAPAASRAGEAATTWG